MKKIQKNAVRFDNLKQDFWTIRNILARQKPSPSVRWCARWQNGPRSRHVWAFSKFINEESLKIAFVQKVIHYIEQNGYVESKAILMRPFFDQPILFTCFIVIYQRSACRLSSTSLTTSSDI